MEAHAVVFERPGTLGIKRLTLCDMRPADILVETLVSGISTGTEKMLYQGSMPTFPGMGYPLVPGYESVGSIIAAGEDSGHAIGETVFVPGANCFVGAAGLFGATAARLVLPGSRAITVDAALSEEAALLALAATAHHAVKRTSRPVGLVIGHGVLGRLVARIILALGQPAPLVWETSEARRHGGEGYDVCNPADAAPAQHGAIVDASGNPDVIDLAIRNLAKQGDLVLAGFYGQRVGFDFAPAFMREVSISIAAEFKPEDIHAVLALVANGSLSLKGLVTHHASPGQAENAYRTAFNDPDCLKMVIDWRTAA